MTDADRTADQLERVLTNWGSALYRQERGLLTGRNRSPLGLYRPRAQALLGTLEEQVEAEGRDPFEDKRLHQLADRFYRMERRAVGL